MADNMPRNVKSARLLALAHVVTGTLLFVFGTVDRVHGYFWTGYGCFGIWCGIWMWITGALGIPASRRERNYHSNAMAGAFMGFSITSSVFGGVTIICYSITIAIYRDDYYYHNHHWNSDSDYHTEMAITAIILILGITEFFIGIWAAVLCCYISSCNCCATPSPQMTSVVYVTDQGVVMGQGPAGVPVAIPVQQAGGVVTVPTVHPQMVHKPATGVVNVAGQPQMYFGAPVAQGGQPQFVGVTPVGAVMGAPGTQQMQMPPPYSADEHLPVKI